MKRHGNQLEEKSYTQPKRQKHISYALIIRVRILKAFDFFSIALNEAIPLIYANQKKNARHFYFAFFNILEFQCFFVFFGYFVCF